jgi:hypothetical protein
MCFAFRFEGLLFLDNGLRLLLNVFCFFLLGLCWPTMAMEVDTAGQAPAASDTVSVALSANSQTQSLQSQTVRFEMQVIPDVVPAHKMQKEFRDMMKLMLDKTLEEYAGPEQFLRVMLKDDDKKIEFAKWLWAEFPEQDDTVYSHDRDLPGVEEADKGKTLPLVVHLAFLGYSRSCSIKPEPGKNVSQLLTDEMTRDGFITSGDPLLVLQPSGLKEAMPSGAAWPDGFGGPLGLTPASVGYLKGMARSTNLLTILYLVMKKGISLRDVHPRFYQSCLRVYCYHQPVSSRRNEALQNMSASCRGSIRKAPNVFSFTGAHSKQTTTNKQSKIKKRGFR